MSDAFPTAAPILLATPMNKVPGVVVTPSTMIHDAIKAQVARALESIPEGKTGALVAIATTEGVNVAVGMKTQNGWEVAGYFGKTWDEGLTAGASVSKTW